MCQRLAQALAEACGGAEVAAEVAAATQVETGSAITWKYPSVVLKGDNSVGEFYSVALTNNYQQVLPPPPFSCHCYSRTTWNVATCFHLSQKACRQHPPCWSRHHDRRQSAVCADAALGCAPLQSSCSSAGCDAC